jgi:predicted glycosyltransferase
MNIGDQIVSYKEQKHSQSSLRLILHFGNGIGMGHQIRCVNLAMSIRDLFPATRILLIGHTNDVRPIVEAGLSYIKAPTLWKLPDSTIQNVHRQLLADIVRTFDPDIFIQDGESDYGGETFFELATPVTALKIITLVRYSEDAMRRIMNSQRFKAANLVVIAQTLDDFYPSIYSQPFLHELALNPKIFFSGPITRIASDQQINFIRTKYGLDGSRPIILFTAGAGGQHSYCNHEGSHDGDRFFEMVSKTCENISQSGLNIQTIVVKGPYRITSNEFTNAVVIPYDPLMPAIIASSSLVVMRPGYNVLYEVFLAKRPAIIIPSVATPEDQILVADNLALTGAVRVVSMGDSEALSQEIIQLLQNEGEINKMQIAVEKITLKNGALTAAQRIMTFKRD